MSKIIQIGNSLGVRIPKHIIEHFQFNEVSLEITKQGLLIKPVKKNTLASWDNEELRKKAKNEEIDKEYESLDIESDDWQW